MPEVEIVGRRLRDAEESAIIECMRPGDVDRLARIVMVQRDRCEHQVQGLREAVRSIFESTELTSTDDEHDPEGATIAYERAQMIALLRQATADLEALSSVAATLRSGNWPACTVCGDDIGPERMEALPTARRCIRCAG